MTLFCIEPSMAPHCLLDEVQIYGNSVISVLHPDTPHQLTFFFQTDCMTKLSLILQMLTMLLPLPGMAYFPPSLGKLIVTPQFSPGCAVPRFGLGGTLCFSSLLITLCHNNLFPLCLSHKVVSSERQEEVSWSLFFYP